ncbi:MAG: hypothetical protein LBU47_06565 [Christensenellaceae bacterium]|jgi:microcystin-dependent protein|nr:hypothetical protein [Christensenellaceae bacterium]
MSVNLENPAALFGGFWVIWGQGRVPVGVDAANPSFDVAEEVGGEQTHQLTVQEMPAHVHGNVAYSTSTNGWPDAAGDTGNGTGNQGYWRNGTSIRDTGSAGGNAPHNNLQPYITCYMWKRTA